MRENGASGGERVFIHEALREAQKGPSIIKRSDFGRAFILVPKNPRDVFYVGMEGSVDLAIGWEPSPEDLMADDWEVTRAEGIEWPERAPGLVQRTWKHFLQRISR